MGDSEDDGDYKRRDKFRTERRGYDGPVERGMTPPRRDRNSAGPGSAGPAAGSDWREPRNASSGGSWAGNRRYDASSAGPGASGGYRRDRYPSPPAHAGRRGHDFSPPHKRIRHIDSWYLGYSWDDRYEGGYDRGGSGYDFDRGYGSHRGYGAGSSGHTRSHAGASGAASSAMDRDSDMVQPPMMTFKTFLSTQDDSISDDEAIKKYAEYKLEFKRQQLNEFFVTHKDEEWFKLKYHPEESLKRREEQRTMLKKRVDVFMDFFNKKQMESLSIDGDQSDELIKLLDCFVIMLEGGNENDFHVLDKPSEEEQDKKSGDEDAAKSVVSQSADSADHVEEAVKAEEVTEKPAEDNEPKSVPGKKRKRKRTKEFDDDSSLSEEEDEEEEEEVDSEQQKAKNAHSEDSAAPKEDNQGEDDSNESKIVTQTNGQPEEKMETNGEDASNDEVMKKPEDENEPRALHKSTSIFLRNLAPTITKLEVEAMCKRYPGFLRAAIADPTPERRWFRRGWVTFERNAKIKEICFSLNNIRLRDCELGAIVNRDLSRRVRTVNGITVDKKVVRQDIKLAAKVITNLDKRWNLWDEECPSTNGTSGMKKKMALAENHNDDLVGLMSNNPLLANITDYLIEEASAEEEELLGRNNDLEEGEEGEEGTSISRDLELIKVLDKLLFYLRMVHSVDFYNHSEYPNEDEMPNRCGILHARGIPPSGKVTQAEIDDYTAMFEKKMGSFLQPKLDLTDDEANKLGMKNEEDEVEKFIQANTQELGKDKWLCPLSGKKFKGPDFVRKHIFNKHGEKIEEVKKEVKYYNNYLKDPKRPQLPENPQNRSSTGSGMTRQSSQRDFGSGAAGGGSRSAGHSDSRYHYSGYPREATSYPVYDDSGRHGGGYERGAGYDRGGYRARQRPDNFNRGPRMPPINDSYNSNRPIITYRDLDAPRDYEDF